MKNTKFLNLNLALINDLNNKYLTNFYNEKMSNAKL